MQIARNTKGKIIFLSQVTHFILQTLKELCSMTTVHLSMVELERDGQRRLEQPFAIFAPRCERVVISTGKLIDYTVQFRLR